MSCSALGGLRSHANVRAAASALSHLSAYLSPSLCSLSLLDSDTRPVAIDIPAGGRARVPVSPRSFAIRRLPRQSRDAISCFSSPSPRCFLVCRRNGQRRRRNHSQHVPHYCIIALCVKRRAAAVSVIGGKPHTAYRIPSRPLRPPLHLRLLDQCTWHARPRKIPQIS